MIDNISQAIDMVVQNRPFKVVLSNKVSASALFERCNIMLKSGPRGRFYQIEKLTKTQAFHENVDEAGLSRALLSLTGGFRQINAFCDGLEIDVKISKKGKILYNSRKVQAKNVQITGHNREKSYILPQGQPIPPLVDLGIFTKDGKVASAMFDKYKQINRFVELIDDEIKGLDTDEINVLDFGCGKSYLTFILYYYLTEIRKIKANITGLDLKADVIEKCNEIAKSYGYSGLAFQLGDINGYEPKLPPDMVVTLHACDTATDYALFNAISWGAKMIFSVPCCQHEVNGQINSSGLPVLTRYGIIKERTSALLTDALRANCLIASGYSTQVLEFIDIAHSPKNLLIRAVRGGVSDKARKQARDEIADACRLFSIKPTLPKLLNII